MVLPAPPREPGWRPQPSGLLALVVVVGVVVGIWWLSGGDPGTPTSAQGEATSQAPSQATGPPGGADDAAGDPPVSGELDPQTGLRWVAPEELPSGAVETLGEIAGGGSVEGARPFENREGILPDLPDGSYRQYPVSSPGTSGRGTSRIVTGPERLFWTTDGAGSFERIIASPGSGSSG